tara:strand:- start:174 stop:485 length:312 start_codon:yes stop_codon:yes gene_type:complete
MSNEQETNNKFRHKMTSNVVEQLQNMMLWHNAYIARHKELNKLQHNQVLLETNKEMKGDIKDIKMQHAFYINVLTISEEHEQESGNNLKLAQNINKPQEKKDA